MARGWLAEGGCSWESASFGAWSQRLAVQRLSGQEPQLPRLLVETCLHKRPPSHSAPETLGSHVSKFNSDHPRAGKSPGV